MSHASSDRPPDSVALRRDELIHALQARERFLDAILGSLETFMTVDGDWRLTYVNKAAAGMARMDAEDLVGRDMRELMPAMLHGETPEQLQRAMAERVDVEYEVAGPEDSTSHGKAYPLADGGLAIYVRDVSEAKRRELERDELFAALELSEQNFAAVFEASPFAMSLTEMPTAVITRVNRAFEDLFGFAREELIGSTSPELGIADPASQAEVARRFAADGVVREFEVQRTRRGGETRILSLNLDWVTVGLCKFVLTTIRDVSKRSRAEAALRASEEALRVSERRYREIVETTGDGIMIGEPGGTISFANQRMADMLGYSLDELTGMNGLELIWPDWQPVVTGNRAALSEGDVVRGEFKLRRKDGTPIWTMFSSTPMTGAAGAHLGNLTMHSDITELKAAEDALRRSDERFRMVLSAAQVTVAAQDEDLRFVWAFNQRTAPADGVIGKTDADILTAEEAEHLTAIKRRVLEEGVELHDQLWLDRPSGRVFLDCTYMPLRDETGKVTGVGVTTVDLTQMRLAEEARRESEETLRSFYDSAPFLMGVARLEEDRTVVVSGNRAMGEFLGMDPTEIAERSGIELGNTPEFESALVTACRESQATGRPAYFEQALIRGGDSVELSFTVAHIGPRADGEPLFSFVADDVTERRRAQRALRESELAAAAQEEKSRLARDLHDSVTQALFAASLKAEALTIAEDTSPEIDEAVHEVRRLTGGALAQMRAMLLELRGEPLENVPLRQLLRNVVEATESRTRTSVELTVEESETLPADLHVALYRIAQEALNNVVRHARAQNVWVDLYAGPSSVRLTVRDDGLGFEPAAPIGLTHLGLRSMRERAAEVGADFGLVTAAGRGTEIVVEWRRPG
jgi:PAS domain S-box-containing protein